MNDIGQKQHAEIIIIKRKRSGGHDAHHGGAWKIAYADFVTAMMAFFLVMWLINASNEETKAAVASYFNPVQLMDTTSNPKGIKDAQYGASSKDVPSEKPKARSDARPAIGDEKAQTEIDDSIFRDPYAILTEIAGGAGLAEGGDASDAEVAEDSIPRSGLLGGDAYRDPFEPEFWAARKDALPSLPEIESEEIQKRDSELEASINIDLPPPVAPVVEGIEQPKQPLDLSDKQPSPEMESLVEELKVAVDVSGAENPKLSVEAGNGSITINLTDDAEYAMFELGSAKPKKEVIEMVAKIASVLNAKQGTIEIAGHTDARPFKSGAYDNWRLSSARAQMAYHMLVRAGVSPDRFGAIIGHASAKPKHPEKPLDAANRRIEIRLITLNEQLKR